MATKPNTELRRMATAILQGIVSASDVVSPDPVKFAVELAVELQRILDEVAPVGNRLVEIKDLDPKFDRVFKENSEDILA